MAKRKTRSVLAWLLLIVVPMGIYLVTAVPSFLNISLDTSTVLGFLVGLGAYIARLTGVICALTAVMYGVVMVAGEYLSALHVGAILAIKILLGVAIYTLGAMLCRMESWREIISIGKVLLGKRKEL